MLGRLFGKADPLKLGIQALIRDAEDRMTNRYDLPSISALDAGATILDSTPETQILYARAAAKYLGDTGTDYQSEIVSKLFRQLLAKRLPFSEGDFLYILNQAKKKKIWGFPVRSLISAIKKSSIDPMSDNSLVRALQEYHSKLDSPGLVYEERRIRASIASLYSKIVDAGFAPGDSFGIHANRVLSDLSEKDQKVWYQLIALCRSASGARPSKKLQDEMTRIVSILSNHSFESTLIKIMSFPLDSASEDNKNILKGLLWSIGKTSNEKLLMELGRLVEREYRNGRAALANAGLFSMKNANSMSGLSQLSMLRQRMRNKTALTLIQKYLFEAADELDLSVADIEDISVPGFQLEREKREWLFDEIRCILRIESSSRSRIEWHNTNGKQFKSVPSSMKKHHIEELKNVKSMEKDLSATLLAQRTRIERFYTDGRTLSYSTFRKRFLDHGLLAYFAKRLIWKFQEVDRESLGLWSENGFKDVSGASLDWIGSDTSVTLWHPANSSSHEVLAWRDALEASGIVQPFKQAHREIYLLTDAERETDIYSNRMAAHILKQHQFARLVKSRGWEYSLKGGFDGGNPTASLDLAAAGLRAELWIEAPYDEDSVSPAGISLYIITDQVRFNRGLEPVCLNEIPPVFFSEVMRDVDLFVGVSSVGNDPNWQDAGPENHRDYWFNYAFGDLNAIARTRRAMLEKILPGMQIAHQCSIEEQFLIVEGKLRTYKIHIGSTNILMEPNNQYLCIVPARSPDASLKSVYLPFEGDTGLSVLLSKAMLLARDEKIKDRSILSQIQRNV